MSGTTFGVSRRAQLSTRLLRRQADQTLRLPESGGPRNVRARPNQAVCQQSEQRGVALARNT